MGLGRAGGADADADGDTDDFTCGAEAASVDFECNVEGAGKEGVDFECNPDGNGTGKAGAVAGANGRLTACDLGKTIGSRHNGHVCCRLSHPSIHAV